MVRHRRRARAGVESGSHRQHSRSSHGAHRRGTARVVRHVLQRVPGLVLAALDRRAPGHAHGAHRGPLHDPGLSIERLGRPSAHRDARGRTGIDDECLRSRPGPVQRRRLDLVRPRRRRQERPVRGRRVDHRAGSGPRRQGLHRHHDIQQAGLLHLDAHEPRRRAGCPRARGPHLPDRPGRPARRCAAGVPGGCRLAGRDPAGHHAAEPGRVRRFRPGDGRDARSPRERLRATPGRRRAPRARVRPPVDRLRPLRVHAHHRRRPHVRPARPPEAARVGGGRRR